jgi:HEAT repeat protein/beta-lactamase regulating signal transducer with metallopeptidase domain
MTSTFSSTALAWLLTYAIHSTVLLSLAWLLVRARRLSPASSELLWKSAMIGAIITASVQQSLDLRPAGTVVLRDAGRGMREAVGVSTEVTGTSDAGQPQSQGGPDASNAQSPSRISHPASPIASPIPRPASIPLTATIVVLWALIALALGLAYVARRLILVGRLGDRRDISEGPLVDSLNQLAHEAGLRTTPRLTATSRISSPVAFGIGEICVPETALTELDREQQRSLLAHELAHLARRDPIWLVAGSLIERVFWIQPLNRVANREIARSVEFLADDWAVRRTGSGDALARCLAQVAEWIQASPLGVPVAGMAEERSLLVSRVTRLIEGVKPANRSRRGLAVGAVAVLVATILVAPGVSGKTGSILLANPVQKLDKPPANLEEAKSSAPPPAGVPTVAALRAIARQDTGADTGVVNALIARLDDENAEVRTAAARSLGRIKDSRAIPGLIGALKDRDSKVRAAAAEALAEFEDARAVAPLAELLNDQSSEVKKTALDALSHFEDQQLPGAAITRLLSDSDPEVRHNAAHLVGRLHDRSSIGQLARLIGDPSPDVRGAAIEALGEVGDPTAATAIVPALSDANADVRQQAIDAIEQLKAPISETTLLALMRDKDADVRQKAAHLAGDRQIVGAVPTLRRLLDDTNGDVRESAVDALGNIADVSAYDALRSALTSKDAKVRRAAAEALGERRS